MATLKVIAMDVPAFRCCARTMPGRTRDLIEDAVIAATAHVHGLTVLTRNVLVFEGLGVPAFDPLKYYT